MIRRGLLWLSERRRVFEFVRRNRVARGFARRFVAGESVEEAVARVRELAETGITATVDLLGESVEAPALAEGARDEYLALLERMAEDEVEVNVSVKLTQMGLDVDPELCHANLVSILDRAGRSGGFVRIDMEGSAYTQRTLDFFTRRLHPVYGDRVGVVIQSALRRSADDVDHLIRLGARVRLCKGAYREPPSVAYADKRDVDRSYMDLTERLLRHGHYPAIATHDLPMIDHARAVARDAGIPPERYEFQMLYGVRRDLQRRLRGEGHRMRVYIPYGTRWYPYLMRRLAERPANLVFMVGNLVREGLSRR